MGLPALQKVLHTCRRKHFKTCAKLACQLMSEYLRPIRTHTDVHNRTQIHANVPEARTKSLIKVTMGNLLGHPHRAHTQCGSIFMRNQ